MIALVTGLYCIMMFASSFVEEEHHYWYWMSTLLACFLFAFQYVSVQLGMHNADNLRTASGKMKFRSILATFLVLTFLRILRRWNQTGQKFAGSPDIGRTFFKQHNFWLLVLVALTYVAMTFRLASRRIEGLPQLVVWLFSGVLGAVAILFRIDFTRADSPELLAGLETIAAEWTMPIGLVGQARFIFLLVGVASSYLVVSSKLRPRRRSLFGKGLVS